MFRKRKIADAEVTGLSHLPEADRRYCLLNNPKVDYEAIVKKSRILEPVYLAGHKLGEIEEFDDGVATSCRVK